MPEYLVAMHQEAQSFQEYRVLERVYEQSEWLVPCLLCTDMPLPCVGIVHGQLPSQNTTRDNIGSLLASTVPLSSRMGAPEAWKLRLRRQEGQRAHRRHRRHLHPELRRL